jgi:predicted small lipoprotein YifL
MKMKNGILVSLTLAVLFSLTSCNKKEIIPPADVIDAIGEGSWKVSHFSEDGNDHTSDMSGYHFTFNTGGVVNVINSADTTTGTWSTNNSDDENETHFILTFTTIVSPFDDLTEDWHVVEQTTTTLKLEDVSGGNGGTDLLTFQKE